MKAFKNKTFVGVIVTILAIGLVATYAPLLFTSPSAPSQGTPNEYLPSSDQAAALAPTVNPSAVATSSTSTPVSPEGFSGLNEENKSLEDLNNLLKE